MALLARKIGDLEELNVYLRGGLVGAAELKAPVYGLDGLTLILTTPAATVTFDTDPEGAQQPLSLVEIVEQINAQAAGYAGVYKGRLRLMDPAATTGVTVGNGTANTILGFVNTQAGVPYAAPGNTAPALVSVSPMQGSGAGYLVVTDEA